MKSTLFNPNFKYRVQAETGKELPEVIAYGDLKDDMLLRARQYHAKHAGVVIEMVKQANVLEGKTVRWVFDKGQWKAKAAKHRDHSESLPYK